MAFRYFRGMKIPIPGIDTAVKVLRPNARYDCTMKDGVYAVSYTHLTLPTKA